MNTISPPASTAAGLPPSRRTFSISPAATGSTSTRASPAMTTAICTKLDAYLCDLKEAQIRDGLHILGTSPTGAQETDLLVALTRVPRGLGEGGDQSLIRALADDFGFGDFDPLACDMAEPLDRRQNPWRSCKLVNATLAHQWRHGGTAGSSAPRPCSSRSESPVPSCNTTNSAQHSRADKANVDP